MYGLVIVIARERSLWRWIGIESYGVFLGGVFRLSRFLAGLVRVVFRVLGEDIIEYSGRFDEVRLKHLNNNFKL